MDGDEREFHSGLAQLQAVQEIAARYGLVVGHFKTFPSGYKVKTNRGIKWIKLFPFTEEELLFVFDFITHLQSKGFHNLAQMHRTVDGSPAARVGQKLYYLTDWIDGRRPDFGHVYELAVASQVLARMHRAGKDFNPVRVPGQRRQIGCWPERFRSRHRDLEEFRRLAQRLPTGFDRRFRRHGSDFLRLAEQAMNKLEKVGYSDLIADKANIQVVHRSFQRKNLMYQDGGIKIVDFDLCGLDLRIEDLAKFIASTCRWEIDRALFVLANYHSINPLREAELRALSAYFYFPTSAWVAGEAYYRRREMRTDALSTYIAQLTAQQEFAREFEQLSLDKLSQMPVAGGRGKHERKVVGGDKPVMSEYPSIKGFGWELPVEQHEVPVDSAAELDVAGQEEVRSRLKSQFIKSRGKAPGRPGTFRASGRSGPHPLEAAAVNAEEVLQMMEELLQASKDLESMLAEAEDLEKEAAEIAEETGQTEEPVETEKTADEAVPAGGHGDLPADLEEAEMMDQIPEDENRDSRLDEEEELLAEMLNEGEVQKLSPDGDPETEGSEGEGQAEPPQDDGLEEELVAELGPGPEKEDTGEDIPEPFAGRPGHVFEESKPEETDEVDVEGQPTEPDEPDDDLLELELVEELEQTSAGQVPESEQQEPEAASEEEKEPKEPPAEELPEKLEEASEEKPVEKTAPKPKTEDGTIVWKPFPEPITRRRRR